MSDTPMNKDTLRYQSAAQDARRARDALSDVEEKSLGDYFAVVGLSIIEGYLSDNHAADDDEDA